MYCVSPVAIFELCSSVMKVKCPYCGCVYEIDYDLLKSPAGSEKLGYGWWLRCYKCKKKWWLKNSTVEMAVNSPLIADREAKINKISQLRVTNNRDISRPDSKVSVWRIVKYIAIFSAIALISLTIYNKKMFYDYLLEKAAHLSMSMASKLTMTNVKYFIEEDKVNNKIKLTVTGKIVNSDRAVAKLKGVRIFVSDSSGKEIKFWDYNLKCDYMMSEDTLDFSTSDTLPKEVANIRVEASIF